jgi:hypothetical protein
MNIQHTFNNIALAMLPSVLNAINSADQHDASQIRHIALRKIMDCSPCLDDMSHHERRALAASILRECPCLNAEEN